MILDTFYLLFKSDSAQATKDVGELDKKVDSLRQTGKKQSEQQQKDTKESTRQHKEFNESLKDTGYQYTKIAESLAQVGVATLSAGSILKSVFATGEINSNLDTQSKLLGKSALELKAYGAAAEAAGGSSQGFQADIEAQFHRFAALGLNTPSIKEILDKERAVLKQAGDDPNRRDQAFQNLGINDPGHKLLDIMPDDEYAKTIDKFQKLSDQAEKGAAIAKEYHDSWQEVSSAIDNVVTAMGSDLFPILAPVNRELAEFFNLFKDDGEGAAGVLAAIALGLGAITKGIAGAIFASKAAAVAEVAAPAAAGGLATLGGYGTAAAATGAGLAIPAAIVAGGAALAYGAYKLSSNYGYGKNATPSDPLAEKKKALGIPSSYGAEMDEQLRLGQIARTKRDLDSVSNMPVGVSNIAVGGGSSKNISVKTGDIHVHSAAADASGIASDTASELERHINLAISNMDDGVKY